MKSWPLMQPTLFFTFSFFCFFEGFGCNLRADMFLKLYFGDSISMLHVRWTESFHSLWLFIVVEFLDAGFGSKSLRAILCICQHQ